MEGNSAPYELEPLLMSYVEDFITSLDFPQAFNWQEQDRRWQEAMKVLALEWNRYKLHIAKHSGMELVSLLFTR
jgi:hypothetical protein